MESTKTAVDTPIQLPPEVLEECRWHVDTQLVTEKMKESDLMFPTKWGGLRSRSCLDKPFAAVTAACGIKKRITSRAMRRTFQDLSTAAHVAGVVAKAITGHATDAMKIHYSTAQDPAVTRGIASVVDIASRKKKTG